MISKREFRATEKMLYNYPKLGDSIRQIELDQEAIKSQYNTYRSFDYTRDKLSKTNSTGNEIEDLVIRKEQLIAKLEASKTKLQIEKEKLEIAIRNLNTEQREIFEERYVNKRTWREITIDRHMSKDKFYRIRDSIVYSVVNSLNPERVVKEVEERFNSTYRIEV